MEADTVVLMITIVGSVLGSNLATIGLLMGKMNRLEDRLNDLAERVARIEGYLTTFGDFTPRGPEQPPGSEPPPENPAPDRRQAS